ncbi:hypothetical protein HK104_001418 [Borealophlyctis nickersoniae]|nr:hypothetical protein HK104_001418 [Borealophlyctis nickersoniae]
MRGGYAPAQAAGMLSQIRRSVENTNVLKERLANMATQISGAASKRLFDFSSKDMAVQLTVFDWEMYSFVTIQDLIQYATNPSQPSHIVKSCMDFSHYLRRLVQSTIITLEDPGVRCRAISHWIDIAQSLFRLHNFQSLSAVIDGLSSPPIARLTRSWSMLPKKTKGVYDDFLSMMSEKENWKWYRTQVDRCGLPAVPRLEVLLADVRGGGGFAAGRATFDYFKASDYSVDLKDRNPVVGHWVVGQVWMTEDQVEEMSEVREPSRPAGGGGGGGLWRGRSDRAVPAPVVTPQQPPPPPQYRPVPLTQELANIVGDRPIGQPGVAMSPLSLNSPRQSNFFDPTATPPAPPPAPPKPTADSDFDVLFKRFDRLGPSSASTASSPTGSGSGSVSPQHQQQGQQNGGAGGGDHDFGNLMDRLNRLKNGKQ